MRAIGGVESVSEHMSRGELAKRVQCVGGLESTLLPGKNRAGNDIRNTKHVLVHAYQSRRVQAMNCTDFEGFLPGILALV